MPRSKNAQIAVDLFDSIVDARGLDRHTAWKAIAQLLLTCEIWTSSWGPFKDFVVFREVNDFKNAGPNALLSQRAENLTRLLATELGVPREELCRSIGTYWKLPNLRAMQPHNLVGHAFRSILVRALQRFGDSEITYEEEADPRTEYPGYGFATRSKNPRIDILARRSGNAVALISSRWRFRHDRVDVVEEAMAYAPAARRVNANVQLYAWLGEFSPSRLMKVIENCPPAHSNPAMSATVHFNPRLISDGLGENGRLSALKDLAWLINQTFNWH
jgi:hypothetical protein